MIFRCLYFGLVFLLFSCDESYLYVRGDCNFITVDELDQVAKDESEFRIKNISVEDIRGEWVSTYPNCPVKHIFTSSDSIITIAQTIFDTWEVTDKIKFSFDANNAEIKVLAGNIQGRKSQVIEIKFLTKLKLYYQNKYEGKYIGPIMAFRRVDVCDVSDFTQQFVSIDEFKDKAIDIEHAHPPSDIINQGITCSYVNLYRSNPGKYKWAGLAALVSGTIGFEEDENRWKPNILEMMNSVIDGNRKVYEDLFWQHLVYDEKGIYGIVDLYCANEIDQLVFDAWNKIDSDDVWGGNRDLLLHEQKNVLQPNLYDDNFWFWYGADTEFGKLINGKNVLSSPVPNDTTYFPSGILRNIASFDQRWNWIDNHILPKWKEYEENEENQEELLDEFKKICPTCCNHTLQ